MLEETSMQKSQAKLRLATISVVALLGKRAKITETVERRRVNYRNEVVILDTYCIEKVKIQQMKC